MWRKEGETRRKEKKEGRTAMKEERKEGRKNNFIEGKGKRIYKKDDNWEERKEGK